MESREQKKKGIRSIDQIIIKLFVMQTNTVTTWQENFSTESVNGKAVLVTGGTTGIGRAIALLLASMGARVMIFGRSEEPLEDTLREFRDAQMEDRVHGIAADVSSKEGIRKIFQEVDEALDGLDILINNASLGYGSIMKGNYDEWQYVLSCNLLGYMACTHEAVKRMRKKGGGHIVNIGSMSAHTKEEGSSVYVATKAGIRGFSESLRKEINKDGIKVTLIEPGAVGTDMQPSTPEEQREKEEDMKMLKAEDIAASVLYALTQPKRCDVVMIQVRPHQQVI